MRYTPLSSDLFKKNRDDFSKNLKTKSIAVFNSNDIYPISADSTLPFQQHRDIYYLSGIDQEESILLLFPEAREASDREILFVKRTDEHIAIWEGEKLTKEKASEFSGIDHIEWLEQFETVFFRLMKEAETIYFNTNIHGRSTSEVQTREDRFIEWCKAKFPAHQVASSAPILHRLRAIKSQEEIDTIKKACDITEIGFREALKIIQPDIWEYEIEATFAYHFLKNKGDGFAYTPIIASGNNANVLHYIQNKKQCKAGEVILMDVASAYANYASDLTRVVPVSGVFSKRQKEVYNALLRVKNYATSILTPGLEWKAYNKEIGSFITKELLELNLLDKADIQNETKERPAYRNYFMHGTSHFLGLDTHDYGFQEDPMQANMVLTVEPGIYIPKEQMGFRLEDNVVIQEKGTPVNLMESIPIEIEEIEMLMNK